MLKLLVILTLLISLSLSTLSAREIAGDNISRDNTKHRDIYSINSSLAIPLGLLAVAATPLYSPRVQQLDTRIYNGMYSGVHEKVSVDNYLQYAPLAMVVGLDIAGVKSRHKIKEQVTILATAVVATTLMVNITKRKVGRRRPDSACCNSFPSGHTATAFMSAEFLRREYSETSPWIGVAGYAFAITTGCLRVYNGRHYLSDVMAGAGVGILGVQMAYWCAPTLNRWIWGSDIRNRSSRRDFAMIPYTTGEQYGMAVSYNF